MDKRTWLPVLVAILVFGAASFGIGIGMSHDHPWWGGMLILAGLPVTLLAAKRVME